MSEVRPPSVWSGLAGFYEDQFGDMATFPHISRRGGFTLGRRRLNGGRLTFEADGIHWVKGSILTATGRIKGTFHLPWKVVSSIDVFKNFYQVNFLGGPVIINLKGGGSPLHGEFLGSRSSLLRAIKASPVGQST
jgi:hypothetical protein